MKDCDKVQKTDMEHILQDIQRKGNIISDIVICAREGRARGAASPRLVSSRLTYIGERLRRLEDEVPREGQRGMVLAGFLSGRVRHQVNGALLPLLLLDGLDVPVSTHCGRLLEDKGGLGLARIATPERISILIKCCMKQVFSFLYVMAWRVYG